MVLTPTSVFLICTFVRIIDSVGVKTLTGRPPCITLAPGESMFECQPLRRRFIPMAKLQLSAALTLCVTLAISGSVARAKEAYAYAGEQGFSTSFYLIGGQYSIYVYAKRPIKAYSTPSTRSCIFGGNFQRLWPTEDSISLGAGVTISTIVPHKIGPAPLTLPPGLYKVYIASLTDCSWNVNLESTNQNAAGVAPVRMLKQGKVNVEYSETASVTDQVQFYAQYRMENDIQAPVSGVLEIINGGKAVATYPLKIGLDKVSLANALYINVQWEPSDAKYLGKNTARFVVKLGSAEFTSTGEFTLTQ
jgi:hypothetical protein